MGGGGNNSATRNYKINCLFIMSERHGRRKQAPDVEMEDVNKQAVDAVVVSKQGLDAVHPVVFWYLTLPAFKADAIAQAKTREIAMKSRLLNIFFKDVLSKLIFDTTNLFYSSDLSAQVVTLKNAIPEKTTVDPRLFGCDLQLGGESFLGLTTELEKFYIREGYGDLYELLKKTLSTKKPRRVCLIGNAGTGKSWYQVYVLRRLLLEEDTNREFELVVRQVGDEFFIIDLVNCEVYLWHGVAAGSRVSLLNNMKKTLYMFEPGLDKQSPPLDLKDVPSLATLSPFATRIEEYKKDRYDELYFWPWSVTELLAIAVEGKRDLDEVLKRQLKFGGILRHILAPGLDTQGEDKVSRAQADLEARLATVNVEALVLKEVNIDRTPTEDGKNVSGFILSYDGRNLTGDARFIEKNIEYTSPYVEEKVEAKLRTVPLLKKVDVVIDRLDNRLVDLSGKNLEAVVTYMFSLHSQYQWESSRVGTGVWNDFPLEGRNVEGLWQVSEKLRRANTILVPSSTNFPVCDIIFSNPNVAQPIVVVQFTWQETHPFSVRAMYDLRVNHLKIADDAFLRVYVISPGKEEKYATMGKQLFLKGYPESLNSLLKFTNAIQVPPQQIQRMWQHTEVHVMRPKGQWKDILGQLRLQLAQGASSSSVAGTPATGLTSTTVPNNPPP